jgi:hypothetical protein
MRPALVRATFSFDSTLTISPRTQRSLIHCYRIKGYRIRIRLITAADHQCLAAGAKDRQHVRETLQGSKLIGVRYVVGRDGRSASLET